MEVREPDARYLAAVQRTELGEFPADWQVVPLDEFDPFITSGSRGWAAHYADIGSTFLRITNLSRSRIYPSLSDLRYVAVPPDNSEGVRTALRAGDVLISITADIGIVGLVTEAVELPAYINQHIALVRFDGREVNSRYVAYFLAGAAAQRRFKSMTDAGAKAGMNLTGVRDVLAAFPPSTDEQAAIADALTDADALIDSLEQLLTKKRQIKQGAMQELLTGKRRLPGFHAAWKTSTVGIEFSVELGKMLDSERNTGLLKPYLGNRAVQWGRIDTSDVQTMPFAHSELDRYRLRHGDLLICEGGEVGRAAIWRSQLEECYYQKALHRLRPLRGYNPNLMLQFLKLWSDIGALNNFVTQTSIAHLPREKLLEIPLPLPSLHEQAALAQVMSEMDAEVDALESRLTKARALKQAMAQVLLTGRIRLVEPTA